MSNTIKTICCGARNWWSEYRALPRESKHLFIAVAVGLLIVYFLLTGMSKLQGRLEAGTEMIDALPRVAPAAVEAIRDACRARWTANEWESDCALFFALREQRAR